MATAFNRRFEYIRIGQPYNTVDGDIVPGEVSVSTVRGTIQPLSGKDAETLDIGARNTGSVKVYSSERLGIRQQDGDGLFYVRLAGNLYELVQEMPFQNVFGICHYKYIGSLVPASQYPEALQ